MLTAKEAQAKTTNANSTLTENALKNIDQKIRKATQKGHTETTYPLTTQETHLANTLKNILNQKTTQQKSSQSTDE